MTIQIESMTRKRRTQRCPECRSANIVERKDEQFAVCQNCGFVLSAETARLISKERIKTNQHNLIHRNRSPAKAASEIENKEPNRENMVQVFEQWKQVRIWDSIEKNLVTALQYITRTAIDLSLPNTALEKATLTYKRIIEKGLLKGRSMKAVCATAIYIGCKESKTAITIRDIANSTKANPRKISHSYRSIIKQLDMSVQTTSVGNYASEIATRLQLSTRNKEVAEKILEALDSSNRFAGKAPTGIACAVIYISSLLTGEKRTQREIAEAAKITETTIRSRCRELERILSLSLQL
jgi:transcription initiation factor TFIIB